MNGKKCIHLWIDDGCYDSLLKYSEDNNRSIANAAAYLLERVIKDGNL